MHHLDAGRPPGVRAEKGCVTSIDYLGYKVWPKGCRQRETNVPVENRRVPVQRRAAKSWKIALLDDSRVSCHRLVVRPIIKTPVPADDGLRARLVGETETRPEVPIMVRRQLPSAD